LELIESGARIWPIASQLPLWLEYGSGAIAFGSNSLLVAAYGGFDATLSSGNNHLFGELCGIVCSSLLHSNKSYDSEQPDSISFSSLNSYMGLNTDIAVLPAILYELCNGAILTTYKPCGSEPFRRIVFGLFLGTGHCLSGLANFGVLTASAYLASPSPHRVIRVPH
jgi:hypothetical protein